MLAMELLIKTRKFANDLGKSKYDDYEILDAINDAMRLLAQVSADSGRIYFRKNTTIEPNDTVPSDYLKDSHCLTSTGKELFRVLNETPGTDEYTIDGDKFKTGAASGTFTLLYFYVPATIDSIGDTVSLPASMVLPIAKTAAYILQQSDNTALSMAQYFMGASSSDKSN